MATQLDLQEQEQIDALKAFWKQYGNLITWLLVLALGGYAAWNGWNWWQREQSAKAAAMYEELDRAAAAGEAEKVARVFDDLKQRYAGTVFAQQAGLLAAKVQAERGLAQQAKATLDWVAEHALESEYQTIARLRLAGVLADAKQYDEALKALDAAGAPAFAALVADRRGDVLQAMGRADAARDAYRQARDSMDPTVEYRRLVEAKLAALGAAPPASAASGVRP